MRASQGNKTFKKKDPKEAVPTRKLKVPELIEGLGFIISREGPYLEPQGTQETGVIQLCHIQELI